MKPSHLRTTFLTGLFAATALSAAPVELPLLNPGFESPVLEAPAGRFDGWQSNSLRGTGTYPLPYKNFAATPHGKQAAVLAAGGFIGQQLRGTDGQPLAVVPGTRVTISFHNLPPAGEGSKNLGVYLLLGNQDGARVAEAIPVRNCDTVDGRISVTTTVFDATKLDKSAPGWRDGAAYLRFGNFIGWVVMDEVQVTIEAPTSAEVPL